MSKFKRYDPEKTWLTADLHLGHANIIDHCGRPFRTPQGKPDVEAMDRTLIANWREAGIGDDHTVIVVGDLAYKCHPRRLNQYWHALPGIKELVPGNHDDAQTMRLPWADTSPLREIWIGDVFVVLCHYALRTWRHARRGAVHCYGHSHGKLPSLGNSLDVGVDVLDFRPARIDTILRKMRTMRKAPLQPTDDDHIARAPEEDDERTPHRRL